MVKDGYAQPVIYTDNVSKYFDKSYYEECRDLLPEYRRRKADMYRLEIDRCLSVGAGMLLKRALSDFGYDMNTLKAGLRGNGKPYFPEICGSFEFNLSHSGSEIMCAVSLDGHQIGCDVEQIVSDNLSVAKRFFHPNEYAYIASSTDGAKEFCRIWTLKESFIKATSQGFSEGFSGFEIGIGENGISVVQPFTDREYVFGQTEINDGYMRSWCLEL